MSSSTPSSESSESLESSESSESLEQESVNLPEPTFGWTAYAEQINGRFAMVGFVLLVLLEFLTRQDLFTWLGLR